MSKIFVLDIGTRSVVGLVLIEDGQQYTLLDLIIQEHAERAMVDGQIHDVMAVSHVISDIKQALEVKHGPIKKVCVAAAGRALKTRKEKITVSITNKPILNKQDIIHLELQAVQKAQFELANDVDEQKRSTDFCVGYSVLHYFLDEEEIGNLIDQQGETASVEVIATFLPKVVVESLMSALHRSGLEMEALTLEPIAAINVLIPKSMRRLNVALVDIGAGTSDIAITANGTVTAYGMVPYAGDEITEALSDQLLLDFPDAEQVKRALSTQESVTYKDILGFSHTMNRDVIVQTIDPSIEQLAINIRDEILRLNQKAPQAVMLIGGGSLTPGLAKQLSTRLGLPTNRVAIRGIDAISNIKIPDEVTKGPELVTPLGIAIAAKENPIEYISVFVNKRAVRLFDVKALTIGDSLLAAGIEMSQLYGKPGMALMFTLNGKVKTIPGGKGQPPILTKNGRPTAFDELVHNGDQIEAIRGTQGRNAKATVGDIVNTIPTYSCQINEQRHTVKTIIYKNGVSIPLNDIISDRDIIQLVTPSTIREVFELLNINFSDNENKPMTVYLNQQPVNIRQKQPKLTKNGQSATLNTSIANDDKIEYTNEHDILITLKQLLKKSKIPYEQAIDISFNGQPVTLRNIHYTFYRNNTAIDLDDLIQADDDIQYVQLNSSKGFIFQDVFRYVDIELNMGKGKTFILLKNSEEATFHSSIQPHDALELKWVTHTK